MTRFAVTTALLLAVVALALPAAAQVISVTPRSLDMGQMQQMEEKRQQVTVTNNGAGRLVISEVDADCGCTVPTLARKELGPGESTVIEINFNSKRFQGRVVKTVTIHSNDPVNPAFEVMLQAEVSSPLLVDPANRRVGFTRGVAETDRTQRVTFTATEDVPLQIRCDNTRMREFEVNVINGLDGNPSVAALDVTLPANADPGRKRDSARVETNIEGFETVDIDMQAWVVARLGYAPAALKLRYQKEFNMSVRFAPEVAELQFKITGAECDLPEVNVEIMETIPNKETLVRVLGAPISKDDPRAIAHRGRIKGTLTVYTDLEDMPKVEIPVTYMVRL